MIYGRKRFPKKIDLAKSWDARLYGYAGTAKTGFFKNNFPGRAGFALSTGDINGDGAADIIIGAPGAKIKISGKKRRRTGKVYVIYGKKAQEGD